jgi:protein-disulfide isomerase
MFAKPCVKLAEARQSGEIIAVAEKTRIVGGKKTMNMRLWWVLLLIGWLTTLAGAQTPGGDNAPAHVPAGTDTQAETARPAVAAPASTQNLETYQGTPVGLTADGAPFRGDPKAPLTLMEYSDYLCPFCGRHFRQTLPALLETYARNGKVQFVFRDYPIASLHPTAPKGSAAALCVAEQGAARFWQMHAALFEAQQQWARQPDPSAFLAEAAKSTGADMTAYEQCLASGRTDTLVQQRVAEGKALGFNGTPSFQFVHNASGKTYTLVGAQPVKVFNQWIEALLAGEEPPEPEKPKPPELPFWAKPEGLAPDPQRPGFTKAGDAYKGNPEAKLVVVEFSDFQCPACQRHALNTQPALDKQFVESGEVLWVAKHFPLRIHPQAPAAAAAAECAGEQGKFWAMHHLLFDRMTQWAQDDPDAVLVTLAEELELDRAQFTTCLTSRKALERVLHDLYDAQGVVRSTPTFILIANGKGSVVRGTRSAEQFAAVLQKTLERAASTN